MTMKSEVSLCICLLCALALFLGEVAGAKKKPKPDPLLEEFGRFNTKATFYEEEYFNGYSTSLETDGECKNLPRRWKKRALSVDTSGTCALLCSDADCQGTCTRIHPNNGDLQLAQVHMAKAVSSVKSCFK